MGVVGGDAASAIAPDLRVSEYDGTPEGDVIKPSISS